MFNRLLTFALFSVAACGGAGKIDVVAYGEALIEEGIPADVFSDGWAVSFTRFSVRLGGVSVAGSAASDSVTVDLTKPTAGAGQLVATLDVPAGSYTNGAFDITEIEVEGSARNGTSTKTFSWTFPNTTHYSMCETTTTVTNGRSARFQITVHADHFFYDSLVSHAPAVLFEPIAAADTNDDGVVSESELRSKGIGAYDPGNEDPANLWEWLTLLSRTVGHIDGEGHCIASE